MPPTVSAAARKVSSKASGKARARKQDDEAGQGRSKKPKAGDNPSQKNPGGKRYKNFILAVCISPKETGSKPFEPQTILDILTRLLWAFGGKLATPGWTGLTCQYTILPEVCLANSLKGNGHVVVLVRGTFNIVRSFGKIILDQVMKAVVAEHTGVNASKVYYTYKIGTDALPALSTEDGSPLNVLWDWLTIHEFPSKSIAIHTQTGTYNTQAVKDFEAVKESEVSEPALGLSPAPKINIIGPPPLFLQAASKESGEAARGRSRQPARGRSRQSASVESGEAAMGGSGQPVESVSRQSARGRSRQQVESVSDPAPLVHNPFGDLGQAAGLEDSAQADKGNVEDELNLLEGDEMEVDEMEPFFSSPPDAVGNEGVPAPADMTPKEIAGGFKEYVLGVWEVTPKAAAAFLAALPAVQEEVCGILNLSSTMLCSHNGLTQSCDKVIENALRCGEGMTPEEWRFYGPDGNFAEKLPSDGNFAEDLPSDSATSSAAAPAVEGPSDPAVWSAVEATTAQVVEASVETAAGHPAPPAAAEGSSAGPLAPPALVEEVWGSVRL